MRDQLITKDTNFKKYFVEEDNIRSLQNEIVFSMLRRYNCWAGCKICYVDELFETDKNEFARYIPEVITQEHSDKWIYLFQNYYTVNTTDDMYWMKTQQPHLFKWYQEHASLINFGQMTDNSFIRSWKILYDELRDAKGCYELTFSDIFLEKINVDELIGNVKKIASRYPITHIKFVQSTTDSPTGNSKKFLDFCQVELLPITIHYNIKVFDTTLLNRDKQQKSWGSNQGDIFTVCGETDYFQYDSFFLTLVDSINPKQEPYDTLDEYHRETHIVKHLNAKKELYTRYVNRLDNPSEATLAYKNYFDWVSKNLKINENYNYIPSVCLEPYHTLYKKLEDDGWVKTQFGMIKNPTHETRLIIPLFTL
jgi:hypothetical protein